MTATCNDLDKSHIQRHDFYVNNQAFVAQFTDKKAADDYQARHTHLDLDRRLRLIEGHNHEMVNE